MALLLTAGLTACSSTENKGEKLDAPLKKRDFYWTVRKEVAKEADLPDLRAHSPRQFIGTHRGDSQRKSDLRHRRHQQQFFLQLIFDLLHETPFRLVDLFPPPLVEETICRSCSAAKMCMCGGRVAPEDVAHMAEQMDDRQQRFCLIPVIPAL